MISLIKDKSVKEFGDFQTPRELAFEVCLLLSRLNLKPNTIIEPTCGLGSFVGAARKIFHSAKILGFDISKHYIALTQDKFRDEENISIFEANFFETDWKELFKTFEKPLLVLGNPPWVTNSQLGVLESDNLPEKKNFQNLSGFDAMTGKSNFDISEWMLINLLESLNNQNAQLAMLVKTSVARKILTYAWKNNIRLSKSAIYKIETEKYFNASVDSCLLFCDFSGDEQTLTCEIFDNLTDENSSQTIGYENGELLASVDRYQKWKYLNGGSKIKWRSGIKHDCSKVMELTKDGDKFKNNLGETFELEDDYVFPMLKSSDIANGNLQPRRWMIVTQKEVKDDTAKIAEIAPKTWKYLTSHGDFLDKRGSSIYKKRARFVVFGIGNYSFAPWKVVISGFYKKLNFNLIGSYENKPIVLDDTCYFLPFENKAEAKKVCELLNTNAAQEFFKSFIFWDAKRPITVDVLQKMDITKLEKFNRNKDQNGLEEALKELSKNYKFELANSDLQNAFNFEDIQYKL